MAQLRESQQQPHEGCIVLDGGQRKGFGAGSLVMFCPVVQGAKRPSRRQSSLLV